MTRKLAQFATDEKTRARYDTAKRWSDLNPVLDRGEFAYDESNNTLKVGNGEKTYNELDSIGVNMLAVYPVGSIYMNMNPTSPAELFGGTWEGLPAGRVLIGQGTADSGTVYEAGSVGGEEAHTLTVDEMPRHNHPYETTPTLFADVDTSGNSYIQPNTSGSCKGVIRQTNYIGGSQAHNNMSPYLVVYMWVRTA